MARGGEGEGAECGVIEREVGAHLVRTAPLGRAGGAARAARAAALDATWPAGRAALAALTPLVPPSIGALIGIVTRAGDTAAAEAGR